MYQISMGMLDTILVVLLFYYVNVPFVYIRPDCLKITVSMINVMISVIYMQVFLNELD